LLNEAFIALLQCPKTGQGLRLAEDGHLLTDDGKIAYPLVDGIPQLLIEDGVETGGE
jgi:uncharacterized protein YbaR (Trm112 family)